MNFSESFNNDIALENQIRRLLNTFGHVIDRPTYLNFRCKICGDSQKSKLKKRGYILKKKKPWIYYCHNCFYKKPVIFWLKEYHPQYYKDYIAECIRLNQKDKKKPVHVTNPGIRPRKEPKKNPEKDHTKHFIPILNGSTWQFAKAQTICNARKIPPSVWRKWFVATDGMYKNRLIIPFYDNLGKIYNYQGRALTDNMIPKYLSRQGEYNSIYNYFNVSKDHPVNVLEGPIDSIFVQNAIAVTGLKIEDVRLKDFPNIQFILDDDKSGVEMSIKLMELGFKIFLWRKFKQTYKQTKGCKDINDVFVTLNRTRQFTTKELEPYFSHSMFDKIYLV